MDGRHLTAGASVAICLTLAATAALAAPQDELEEFQLAMNAYDTGDYEEAEKRFRALLERDPPVQNKALVFEIHKYLGATLMYLGEQDEAEKEFEALLREDPDYELDPVLFPTQTLDVFTSVKVRIADELAKIAEDKAEAEAEAEAKKAEAKERLFTQIAEATRPLYLAREVRDWQVILALLPFGTGQFHNGQHGKGWAFFSSELALTAASVVLFGLRVYYERLANEAKVEAQPWSAYKNTAQRYYIAGNVVAGVAVAAMLAGIIDALVYFVRLRNAPVRFEEIDEQDVPPELRKTPPDIDEQDIEILLGAGSLVVRW